MNQHLAAILQKLSISNDARSPQSPRTTVNHTHNSSVLSLSKLVKLELPRFFGEEPTGWVYKANQYFMYYNTPATEQLLMASFHMEGDQSAGLVSR